MLEDCLAQCQKRMEQGLEAEAKLAEAQVFPLIIALFWVMFRVLLTKGVYHYLIEVKFKKRHP